MTDYFHKMLSNHDKDDIDLRLIEWDEIHGILDNDYN